jgi:hypothetical protein
VLCFDKVTEKQEQEERRKEAVLAWIKVLSQWLSRWTNSRAPSSSARLSAAPFAYTVELWIFKLFLPGTGNDGVTVGKDWLEKVCFWVLEKKSQTTLITVSCDSLLLQCTITKEYILRGIYHTPHYRPSLRTWSKYHVNTMIKRKV